MLVYPIAALLTLPAILPLEVSPIVSTQVIEVLSVTKVYDGDTFAVDLSNCSYPVLCRDILVRIEGIDAPEIRAKCASEKAAAIEAKKVLQSLVSPPHKVKLLRVVRDKYFRLRAKVMSDDVDVGEALIATGKVRVYRGEMRTGWCDLTAKAKQ